MEDEPVQLPPQPINPDTSAAKRPRQFRPLWLVVGLVVLALIGGGGYWTLGRHQSTKPLSTQQTPNQQTTPTPDDASGTPTTYVSKGSDLNLSFSYPSSWQVTPPSGGNTDDQVITLTSPRSSIANAQNESVVARVILTIRPKTDDIAELDSGTVVVAQNSYQIAYAHPTKVQHGYPFLTFMHLAGGKADGLFEEVMVTGANKFAKGQVLYSYSLLQLDPVISATFYECQVQACSGSGATYMSITDDTWQTSDLGQQVKAIFESLELH